jgi:hypothetical protein
LASDCGKRGSCPPRRRWQTVLFTSHLRERLSWPHSVAIQRVIPFCDHRYPCGRKFVELSTLCYDQRLSPLRVSGLLRLTDFPSVESTIGSIPNASDSQLLGRDLFNRTVRVSGSIPTMPDVGRDLSTAPVVVLWPLNVRERNCRLFRPK